MPFGKLSNRHMPLLLLLLLLLLLILLLLLLVQWFMEPRGTMLHSTGLSAYTFPNPNQSSSSY